MKALKALVVGMGILIIAALGVIVVTLYNRAAGPGDRGPETAAGEAGKQAGVGAPLAAFGTARIGLPAGSTVLGMNAADGRLLLRTRRAGGGEWIYVIDLATGATLGKIEVTQGE
jgi:hypothetical protein